MKNKKVKKMIEMENKYVTIRDLFKDYVNGREMGGVVGYGGLLDIRPSFQRKYVCKDAKRNAVIDTVRNNYHIGVMYWVKKDDGTFEVLDGQHRTISICDYVKGDYSIDKKYFHRLSQEEQDAILDYKLNICIYENCTNEEKVDIFTIANTRMSRRKVLSHE
jgi:hypothetical protein